MKRGCLLFLLVGIVGAQVSPPEDPMQAAFAAYESARNQGRVEEASAKRELARTLLDQMPPDSFELGQDARRVAQMYQNAGMSVQAIAIGKHLLTRNVGSDARIELLQMTSEFYSVDRNLLQAAACLEQLVAAIEEAGTKPKAPASNIPQLASRVGIVRLGGFSMSRLYNPADRRVNAYRELADVYQRLGRPDAVAAVTKRMLAAAPDPGSTAQYYESQGRLDEAAAVYKKQAEQAEPQARALALQALSNVYQRERRYGDAVDALQQSIALTNASGTPDKVLWPRMNLAQLLNQAGQAGEADKIFEQLLAENTAASDGNYLQILRTYVDHLSMTKRYAPGQALLKDYLASHPGLQEQEQAGVLLQLADSLRRAGHSEQAEQYQKDAMERQQRSQPPQNEDRTARISKDLQTADAAIVAGKYDDALEIALRALGAIASTNELNQLTWPVQNTANQLANHKQFEKAEQLSQRLLDVTEKASTDNSQPFISALESYSRLLMQQESRWHEAPAVIKRYHDLMASLHGPVSGEVADVMRLTMDFERWHGAPQAAVAVAQEIVALNEKLSGNTSEFYLRASEGLAMTYQSTGDPARALPILRRNVAIADLVFRPEDVQRAQIRMNAAHALAQQKQFDEAEQLATEAVAIGKAARPPQAEQFTTQLEGIRKMRTAAPGNGNNPWFQRSKP